MTETAVEDCAEAAGAGPPIADAVERLDAPPWTDRCARGGGYALETASIYTDGWDARQTVGGLRLRIVATGAGAENGADRCGSVVGGSGWTAGFGGTWLKVAGGRDTRRLCCWHMALDN